MGAADETADKAKAADQGAKPDGEPRANDRTERDKALDDLVAELFFALDRAESDEPRNWLQLVRRAARAG